VSAPLLFRLTGQSEAQRSPEGKIVTVEPLGSVFTFPAGINDLGMIAGYYADANGATTASCEFPASSES